MGKNNGERIVKNKNNNENVRKRRKVGQTLGWSCMQQWRRRRRRRRRKK